MFIEMDFLIVVEYQKMPVLNEEKRKNDFGVAVYVVCRHYVVSGYWSHFYYYSVVLLHYSAFF